MRLSLLPAVAFLVLSSCAMGRLVDRSSLAAGAGWKTLPRACPLPRGKVTRDCGPEAVAAILAYFGKPSDVDAIERELYDPAIKGTVPPSIPPVVRRRGLSLDLTAGRAFTGLRESIDRGWPAMIMVTARGQYHFFVVIGYNDRLRLIACEDYDSRILLLTFDELDATWKPTQYWTAVLREADVEKLVEDGFGFEESGDYDQAKGLYERALKEDPGHPRALMGLGNCLLNLKPPDLEGARARYEKALPDLPEEPRLLNNLAHVLVQTKGDAARAEELAGKAVDLARARIAAIEEEGRRKPMLRPGLQTQIDDLTYDLSYYYGTLAQAREARGSVDLAVAAWAASLDAIPLDEFERRARRLLEMGLGYRKMSMPAKAKEHLERAAAEAVKGGIEALAAQIQELLKGD